MASSSKGQRLGSWLTSGPYPQLMRPRFLDPLSPLGEISSFTLISDWYVGLRANAFHMSMTTGKPLARLRRARYRAEKALSLISSTRLKQHGSSFCCEAVG